MNRQLEIEEETLDKQLDNGEITVQEYNRYMRELHESFQAYAEERAREAYDREMYSHGFGGF
jgi:predicted  nucleic acid-binding Zn-ribbon protein